MAGLTNVAISEVLKCTHQTVGIVLRSPMVKREIQRQLDSENGSLAQEVEAHESKARSILEKNSGKAADTQVDLLDSDDDSVRLRASGSILDRVLGKPESPNASEGAQVRIEIKTQDAQLLVLALRESKEISSHAQDSESATNGQTADTAGNEQGDVCETPQLSTGIRHRETETQAPEVRLNVKPVPNLSQSQFNGGKDTPPTK